MLMDSLFIGLQYLLPQHTLSRIIGRIGECRWRWLRLALIRGFIRRYGVDMSEAAEPDPGYYLSFNDFFTRALRDDARPLATAPDALISPADGTISQIGDIGGDRLLQAKGQYYSLTTLVGGDPELASRFDNGRFATIYLAPGDYHRVHMPATGQLSRMIYVPGELFSVNDTTASHVPRLFTRNERLVCVFETDQGPMVMVLVGAMIVAAIHTVWAGQVAPVPRRMHTTDYARPPAPVHLARGAEMGRFQMGSTVILLLPGASMDWHPGWDKGHSIRMGESLGQWRG